MGPGSPLHALCASPYTTLSELRNCLAQNPDAPFVTNVQGQTPLLLLTENIGLWHSPTDTDVHTFAKELVHVNPAAVAMTDCESSWPCRAILMQWTEDQEAEMKDKKGNALSNFVRGVGTTINISAANAFSTSSETQSSRAASTRRKFPTARLTAAFESALNVLSLGITSPTITEQLSPTQQLLLRQKICHHIATDLPQFLPALLLLEPELVRQRVLNLPLVRRLLLEPASVGSWLVSMIRRQGLPSHRAVDYLVLVSDSSFHDFLPNGVVNEDDDTDETEHEKGFRETKLQVLNAIGDMGELIPSLFVLEAREIDRATSVNALWYIMDKGLKRPFVIGIVLIDFVLHLTLMLSFRDAVIGSSNESKALSSVPSTVVKGKFNS